MESDSASDLGSLYDRQTEWKESIIMEQKKLSEDKIMEEMKGLSFEPKFYSKSYSKNRKDTHPSTDKSQENHIQRMRGVQKEREQPDTVINVNNSSMEFSTTSSSSNLPLNPPPPHHPNYHHTNNTTISSSLSSLSPHVLMVEGEMMRGGEEDEEDGEMAVVEEEEVVSIFTMLERERKEWRRERSLLLNTIHLQQMELSRRADAVINILWKLYMCYGGVCV